MNITRLRSGPRMSQGVIHAGTLYLAGQVAQGAPGAAVTDQTRDILERIDLLLEEAGTDRSRLLSAIIWLTDMRSFDEMNRVWDAWIGGEAAPCRACVQSPALAAPQFTVEIMVTAAV